MLYLQTQLSKENKTRRTYFDVYNELNYISAVAVENSLSPLKELYEFKPEAFESRDADLSSKAAKFVDNRKQNSERFRENVERDKRIKRIFKQVETQRRRVGKKKEYQIDLTKERVPDPEQPFGRRGARKRPRFILDSNDGPTVIDDNEVEQVMNSAEVQCLDNLDAFFDFKSKKLFPN